MKDNKKAMNVNILDALNAYNKASSLEVKGFGGAEQSEDFTSLVEKALQDTKGKLDNAEATTIKSVKGEVSLDELAISIANAEVSLKALISIRDKLVSALQDILRMPI